MRRATASFVALGAMVAAIACKNASDPAAAPPPPQVLPPPPAPPPDAAIPDAPAAAGDDLAPPADWTALRLGDVAGASFQTKGAVRVPKGTTATGSVATSGSDHYAMAMLTLPSGQHVTFIERAPAAAESPDKLVDTFRQVGMPVVSVRRDKTWFAVATSQDGALAVTAETWAARPGLSVGAQDPTDPAGVDTIVRIAASLAPAP